MKSGSFWSYREAGYFQDEPEEDFLMAYNPPETPEEYRSRNFFSGEGNPHQVVEQMILADGGLVRIVRHQQGDEAAAYTFFHRKTAGDESPIIRSHLTEDEALTLYADALQADVMEVD